MDSASLVVGAGDAGKTIVVTATWGTNGKATFTVTVENDDQPGGEEIEITKAEVIWYTFS